jgi:hypothetical protein
VDAGENLEIWRARPGAIHGWLSLSIDIQRVAPTQMDHLPAPSPKGMVVVWVLVSKRMMAVERRYHPLWRL